MRISKRSRSEDIENKDISKKDIRKAEGNMIFRSLGRKGKICTIAVTAALVLSLAGCGSNNENKGSEGSSTGAADQGTVSGEGLVMGQDVYLFGKIGEVIGNEVTIQLAKMPEVEEPAVPETEQGKDAPAGEIAATVLTIPAQAVNVGEAGGAGMDLEYTGETVTVTVPAGLDIRDTAGQQTTVNSLTKGNVIQFGVDNMDDLNLKSITVLE